MKEGADQPRSGPSTPRTPRAMALSSLGTKLALTVVLVLGLASAIIGVTLSERARASVIESKTAAASMMVDLFAASVAPVLDFDDDEALNAELGNLRANKDVLYAAVWKEGEPKPAVELGARPPGALRPVGVQTRASENHIEYARQVSDPTGKKLGVVAVHLSLANENAEARRLQRRIVALSALVAAAIAALVIAVARQQVLTPLNRLARAARRLERGERVEVEVRSADEVGNLGRAFNAMAAAIVDREQRLEAVNKRQQELFDHMRQAVVVIGEDGMLDEVRSRHALDVLDAKSPGREILWELLYPDDPGGVEAEALREWLNFTVGASAGAWDELAKLAPTSAVLHKQKLDERMLTLEFRPIVEGDVIKRLLLLATDETEKRRLERAVEEQGQEHLRQMAAMRRLIAGGGQLLVRVLDGARERLGLCREMLERPLAVTDAEAFFHYAHTIKGEARAFDLGALGTEAALLEDKVAELRRWLREHTAPPPRPLMAELGECLDRAERAVQRAAELLVEASPIGPAILEQVTVRRTDIDALLELVGERRDQLGRVVSRLASRPFGESTFNLAEAAVQWAMRSGKRARLACEGGDVMVPPALARVLPGVLSHLVRNAVAHGIEAPEERERAGKAETGLVVLRASSGERGPVIAIEDDGRGIDQDAVRRRAGELGLDATASPAELVLSHGLTTRDTAEDLAGRGVGLSAVRAEVEKAGYSVTLTSESGRGTTVTLCPVTLSLSIEKMDLGPKLRDTSAR
jgi:two-component system, chemotaxis family, sensor kinase CheA